MHLFPMNLLRLICSFHSRYLLSFFRRKILRTGCWIPTRQPARIHLQYIILHPPAFVKDFLQKNFPQALSTEIVENRRNCVTFAPPGFPQFPHPPHRGDSLWKFQRKIIVFHKRGVDFQQRLWYTIILWTAENLGGTAQHLCGVALAFPAHPSKHGVCRHSGTVIFSGRLFNTRRILPL